ncbi:MAG TPA: cold shock domain-containing protein [Lacibacter sp.]|nr:cold shock domain-containing protein [Lacibacter sp.]
MAETWNKKEREKKRQQQKKDKAEKKLQRKEDSQNKSFDDMIAYIDENGNLSSTPPDPKKMRKFKLEDIEIGVPKPEEVDPAELIRNGTITFFNESKGYGFIKDLKTQESIFVHVNSLVEPVSEKDKVSFEVEMGPRGANAVNVKKVNL